MKFDYQVRSLCTFLNRLIFLFHHLSLSHKTKAYRHICEGTPYILSISTLLSYRPYGYHSVELCWLGLIRLKNRHRRATYARGSVVEVKRIAVCQRTELVCVHTASEVLRRVWISVEVERLVHFDLYTCTFAIEQLQVTCVGTKSAVLWHDIWLVHVGSSSAPYAYLITSLAVWIVLFRSTTVPCDVVEAICYGCSESKSWQE